jgi:hypothetical protein
LPLLLTLCATAAGQDPEAAGRGYAFLEVSAEPVSPYAGQPVTLRLRIGLDEGLLREGIVPLFGRPMDVQVQVRAPWLDALPGATRLEDAGQEDGRARSSLALNDSVVRARREADRVVEERAFAVLALDRSFLFSEPGETELAAPTIRFAFATKFEEDFLEGRRPLDRRDALVHGEAFALRVRALPEEGRPAGFTGAVGRFTVAATAAPRELTVGESFALTLTIEGEGNLDAFDTPRLDGLPGFHVYGALDDRGAPVRTVTYDLAPVHAGVTEVPPVPFHFFDPGPPPGYRAARTAPIPLDVRPSAGAPASAKATSERPPAEESSPIPVGLVLGAAALVALIVILLLLRRRARAAAARDPEEALARTAADQFRRRIEAPGADVAAAFTDYLAARLDCPPAAVISPTLDSRLRAAGIPAELAARTATLVERLVSARYGGDGTTDDAASARAVLEEIEASIGGPEN